MSMIFSDSDVFLEESLAEIKNKITNLNINSDLKNSINSDLKQIEEVILLQQHKLSFLTDRNLLGVILWNTAFEVTDWNHAASNIFGYTKQEALGCHAAGLIVPETVREEVNQVMAALLKQEGGINSTNQNVTKDGRVITCKWYNMPVTDLKGDVVGDQKKLYRMELVIK